MPKTKLTIAIPTYNRKEYLLEAIRSIIAGSFQDYKIIVFDNASDYDVAAFLAEFNDDRIGLVRNATNVGNLQNLCNIFDYQYDSEYLMVFHDDDTLHPQLLDAAVDLLDRRPNLAWVNCIVNFVKDHEKMFDFVEFKNRVEIVRGENLARWLLSSGANLSFDGAVYRISRLKRLNHYVERFFKWCDRPFMIDMAMGQDVAIIRDKLLNYRLHPGQDSKGEAKERQQQIFDLQKYYKEKLSKPLSAADERLFDRASTNAMIITGLSFAPTLGEYISFIKKAGTEGLFKYKHVNLKGLYYLVKVMYFYLVKVS